MMAKRHKLEFWEVEYTDFGSLDCPCEFCEKKSYQKNFHIKRNREVELVICEDCLNEIKDQECKKDELGDKDEV